MRTTNVILIATIGILFCFNYDICNWFYDSAIETKEWWDLRFKIYSVIATLLGLTVFCNADRFLKTISIPILAMFIGDLKDRILFDEPQRHWSDILLVVISIIFMILIWQKNNEPRE